MEKLTLYERLHVHVAKKELKKLFEKIGVNYELTSKDTPEYPQCTFDYKYTNQYSFSCARDLEQVLDYLSEQLKTIEQSKCSNGYIFLASHEIELLEWIKLFDVEWSEFLRKLSENLRTFSIHFILEGSNQCITVLEQENTYEVYKKPLLSASQIAEQNIERFIADFKASKGEIPNGRHRLLTLAEDSEPFFQLCQYFLSTDTDTSDVASEKQQFGSLLVEVLNLPNNKEKNQKWVIKHAALQFPELFHAHLAGCPEALAWRNLPPVQIEPFKQKLLAPEISTSDKRALLECLLQTRDLATVQFAYQFAVDTNINPACNAPIDDDDLELVGFTVRDGNVVSYCHQPVFHLQFPSQYLYRYAGKHPPPYQHPTYHLSPLEQRYQFGGVLQDDEKNPFSHLITLDPIPEGLPIIGLNKLTLGIHLAILNQTFEPVYYQHDPQGNPHPMASAIFEPKWVELPIKATQVALAKTPSRWVLQSDLHGFDEENLFRLGGEPTWIQNAEVLECPVCQTKMDFLMQLASQLPDLENQEILFGSGGICYIFWCDACNVNGYIQQCT